MRVQLHRKSTRYAELTPQQQYAVIGIEACDFRLLNDRGQPYLYPHHLFKIVDPHEPDDWITEYGEDGERYAYPLPLHTCGFFEDFFDAKPETVATFWQVVNQRLATAMGEVS